MCFYIFFDEPEKEFGFVNKFTELSNMEFEFKINLHFIYPYQ